MGWKSAQPRMPCEEPGLGILAAARTLLVHEEPRWEQPLALAHDPGWGAVGVQ